MRAGRPRCDPRRDVPWRCLIVDDSPRFGVEARTLLEQQGLTVVGVASSGDEAVRLTEALRPELALVDISLGGESGFDVARRLADGANDRPPAIILVSTYDEQEFSGRIAASPAVGFIAKTELSVERIRRLLDADG
jgi:two-component system, NarL family, nitrate/nitrite response regulator NarL